MRNIGSSIVSLTLISFCGWSESKQDLEKAFEASSSQGAVRITINSQAGAMAVKQIWEIVKPDRFHFVQSGASGSQEVYAIGKVIFVRELSGWKRLEVAFIPNPTPLEKWVHQAFGDSLATVVLIGDETKNGYLTHHYTSQFRYQDSYSLTIASCDSWVTSATGLPLQMTCKLNSNGTAYELQEQFEFGSSVVVLPPA